MYRFYTDAFVLEDDESVLHAATVRWSQDRAEDSQFLMQLQMLIVGSVFAIIFLLSFEPREAAVMIQAAIGLAALEVLILLFGHRLCTVHRKLTFHRDGSVVMPGGWFNRETVVGYHDAGTTIQAQQTEVLKPEQHRPKKFEVWLYFAEGHSFPIAEELSQQQAHEVTVQLTRALQLVKSAMARLPQDRMGDKPNWGYATVE